MNTASLELCKELYELSGWTDTDKWLIVNEFGESSVISYKAIHNEAYPAYDLGYLLRKLPYKLPNTVAFSWLTVTMGANSAVAKYSDTDLTKRADTPENVLCKLAIELFKQGILK